MLTKVLLWLAVGVPVACAMEPWAAMLHGRVWHGRLWRVHASHHTPRLGRFELNDALSILHAPIAVALILWGCMGPDGLVREAAFGAGLGMTLFGIAYVLVHDGLVHGRLPVGPLRRSRVLDRVRRAHLAHHRRDHAGPYGLFLGPAELAREATARRRARAPQRSARPGPSVANTSR